MNWRENQLRFSIRTLKVAVASVVVGLAFFAAGTPVVQADSSNQTQHIEQLKGVTYRYVLESELTPEEQDKIITHLPSDRVGQYDTYYMVYRPVGVLPETGTDNTSPLSLLGGGLLIVGVSFLKGKKKKIITSLVVMMATGAVSVSALGGGDLSGYDHFHQLAVGSVLPETAITIPNHQFVGYLLYDSSSAGTQSSAVSAVTGQEVDSSAGLTPAQGQLPVTSRTEVVPFATEVIDDPTLPMGEETVVQEGRLGSRTLTYQGDQLLSSQLTEAPQARIIKRGSQIVAPTVEETRRVVIPFETKIIEDAHQYTDYYQETPGQEGQLEIREIFQTSQGVKSGQPIARQENLLVAPIDRVITIGTKPIEGQQTEVKIVDVAPGVTVVQDPDQYEDYYHESPGVAGQTEVTETYATIKGEKQGLPIASSEVVLTAPVSSVVTVGQKPIEDTITRTEDVEIPYGTDIVEDDTQYTDYYDEISGQVGQGERTETFRTIRGEIVGDAITSHQVEHVAPVNARVTLGTKPILGEVEETRIEPVAFETDILEDENQYTDFRQETPGQLGQKEITEVFQTVKGEKIGQPRLKNETLLTPPIKQVVVVGRKPIEGEVTEVRQETIPVVTETRYDDTQYEDYRVEIDGQPGVREVTERFKTYKGDKTGLPTVISDRVLTPQVPKIILIGSKAIEGQVTETRQVSLDPDTTITYDDAEYEDYRLEIPGQSGKKVIAETFRTLKGDKTDLILDSSETILVEPVAKRIVLGRKPLIGTEVVDRRVPLDFTTRLVEDATQYTDYRQEEGGQPGEKMISERYTTLKGERIGQPIQIGEEILVAPVERVITVGTKPIEGTTVVTREVAVDFAVSVHHDETQYTDYRQETGGTQGRTEIAETFVTIKGQIQGAAISHTERLLTAPIDKVIVIGTKPINGSEQVAETVTTPFDTIEETDDSKYTDYAFVRVQGQAGEKVITTRYETIKGVRQPNPTVTEEETVRLINQIVVKGTKPIEGTVSVETTAPVTTDEIDYQDSPDLDEGETQEVSPAVAGVKTITTVYKTVRGVQTSEVIGTPTEVITTQPVKAVVKRGTRVRTEAERQNPTPAATIQTVSVGQRPSAEASVETADLTNVASYTWQTEPSTATVGQNVPGTVLVTYTDQSTDEVPVTINVIRNKTKPNLLLEELIELDEDKKISLNYALEDPTSSYKGATISIYNGDDLVKAFALSTMDAFDVSDLDWDITYTLKGQFTYDLEDGNGVKTEDLSDRQFELTYKHLEIKHVVSAGLFQKQADGTYKQLDMIKEAPTEPTNYYVKVNSDQQRDMYLSVNSIEAVEKDGKQLYKVVTTAPELIQYSDDLGKNQDNYTFYVRKFVPSEGNKIRTFTDLINAMTGNRTGTFELDEDLKADEYTLPAGAKSYVTGNFSGRLLGNNHAIYNLKAPLFEGLQNNFEIRDLDLKQVAINQPAAAEIGALAKTAYGYGEGRVSNVAVQGSILADRSVGGLIYRANNVRLEQVSFEGDITARNSSTANFTGGLIGYAQSNTQVNGALVDATIRVNGQYAGTRAGGAVGVMEHARTGLTNLVAKGVLDNSSGNTSAYVGGLVGQVIASPQFTNTITEVKVLNGRAAIGNLTNTPSRVFDIATVDGVSTGASDATATAITAEAAKAKQDAMGLTVTLADSGIDLNAYDVDYQAVRGAEASKAMTYKNIEKFLPLYNKEFIVKHGNLLAADHDLATKSVVSVIPMADDRFVSDYLTDKRAINKVMVYFADGTKAYYNVSYLEDFKQTGVAEYQVDGLSLLYTPEQVLSHLPSLASQVLPALSGVEYYATETLTALGKTGNAQELMDKLYLKESFDAIKGNLANILQGVLSTADVIATDRTDLADRIIKNKEALIMGLSYVNRWFNIDFGQVNAKDLMLYHQDLFGKSASTLDWLISLGQSYDQLKLINHLDTYANITKAYTGVADEFDYLSAYRRLFTTMDENTWFKATSKVYMAEGTSLTKPDAEVRAYHKLLEDGQAKKFILPLLTAREGIFFISNMSTLNFGMFDRYMDMSLKTTDPARYEAELARVKAMVDASNIRYRDHFDFWYRMSLDPVKDKNIKAVPNWDGYNINRPGLNRGRWLPMVGDTNDAIKDFFGPIDGALWSQFGNNGAGAYATGLYTHFIILKMLEEEGASGHTHEMVHNSDGTIYLGGYGRRFGQGPELYALGLLQAPYTAQTNYFAINHLFDFRGTAAENADTRYHNLSPDRFQTRDDLKDYFHGVFDVLYTLDQVEAETVLSLPKDQQRLFYHKIENTYIRDAVTNAETHAGNRVRKFTDEEWQNLTLNSVADLIDHDIVSNREFAINSGTSRDYARNGYHTVPFFSPIYSALDNPNGAPGDIMFRRMAFELLAEKGYEGGFLQYVSGQYTKLAKDRGITGTETWPRNHTVGRITDDLVFEQVFGSEHADWKAFKKAMFQERAAKLGSLKPITITYKGATVTISSADQLKQLMTEATQEDLTRFLTGTPLSVSSNNNAYANNSRVKELKAKIFNAYLRQTDDFRGSIYN